MLLQIRRPTRPEPRPLRARTGTDPRPLAAGIWLSVRPKRSRTAAAPGRKSAAGPREPFAAPKR
jgi:hypothetical protein